MTHAAAESGLKTGRLILFWGTVLWTFVLAAIFAIQNNAVVFGWIGATGTMLSAVATIIAAMKPAPSWSRLPKWLRSKAALRMVIALLAADIVVTVVWPVWTHRLGNRPINAISQLQLADNVNLLPGQGAATIEIAVEPWRNSANITLESSDHNPAIGTCRPGTQFDVTPRIAGNPGKALRVAPGEQFTIDIPPSVKSIHLTVAVTNTRQEKNCGIDLSVAEVVLANN